MGQKFKRVNFTNIKQVENPEGSILSTSTQDLKSKKVYY
jgi:hypothetical protein